MRHGLDRLENPFDIKKVANQIIIDYNALVTSGPVGLNICIHSPVDLEGHVSSINTLVHIFRESFASDAVVVYNSDHKTFYFDFS